MLKKKENQIPVAIYIRYDIESEDFLRKEEFLKKYCEDRNYKVLATFREIEPTYEFIASSIRDIMEERHHCYYRRLIAIDMSELGLYDEQIFTIYSILRDNEVCLETIKEGVFGEDMLFGVSVLKNVKQKQELEKLKNLSFSKTEPF